LQEPNTKTEAVKTVDLDESRSEDWQEPSIDQTEQQGIEQKEKKPRISDQLIF